MGTVPSESASAGLAKQSFGDKRVTKLELGNQSNGDDCVLKRVFSKFRAKGMYDRIESCFIVVLFFEGVIFLSFVAYFAIRFLLQ